MTRNALILLLLTMPTAALAGASPWQEVAPSSRVRLVTSDALGPDRTTWIGIELDMPQDFKTYWRVPGESGVPTQLAIEGSSGIGSAEIAWPFPSRETGTGLLDNVYHGHTVLPVKLTMDAAAASLKATVTMGICSEICVPVQARFDMPLSFDRPDHAQGLRILQARADAPIAWDKGPEPIGPVTFDRRAGALQVTLTGDGFDPASLIADVGDPAIVFGTPQKSPIPGAISIPLLGSLPSGGLEGRTLVLTFMTEDGPYEVFRQL
ncbi:MAG TPA: protein-disulfide reductase DsbD domain-containing protein [Devosiaceae bacterium]